MVQASFCLSVLASECWVWSKNILDVNEQKSINFSGVSDKQEKWSLRSLYSLYLVHSPAAVIVTAVMVNGSNNRFPLIEKNPDAQCPWQGL